MYLAVSKCYCKLPYKIVNLQKQFRVSSNENTSTIEHSFLKIHPIIYCNTLKNCPNNVDI